ncbi:unnamed protein product [Camellia sinensis]
MEVTVEGVSEALDILCEHPGEVLSLLNDTNSPLPSSESWTIGSTSTHHPLMILPPIDIQWVWFCHTFNPMKTRSLEFAMVATLAILWSIRGVIGIRFVIDREECFSHNVEYDGDTIHLSFVVIKFEGSWHYAPDGADLVVKGPSGNQIHDFLDKTSEKFEFVAHQSGIHRFCFTNKSPYHEIVDFDVHEAHFSYHDQHAKDREAIFPCFLCTIYMPRFVLRKTKETRTTGIDLKGKRTRVNDEPDGSTSQSPLRRSNYGRTAPLESQFTFPAAAHDITNHHVASSSSLCNPNGRWYSLKEQQNLILAVAQLLGLHEASVLPKKAIQGEFPVRLENPHVISTNQIWARVVPAGPSGYSLNSSYRSRDSIEYKLELGWQEIKEMLKGTGRSDENWKQKWKEMMQKAMTPDARNKMDEYQKWLHIVAAVVQFNVEKHSKATEEFRKWFEAMGKEDREKKERAEKWLDNLKTEKFISTDLNHARLRWGHIFQNF